ncbi:MAG TPA: AmmeMemoRadiSam system protein A, partial [Terriglobales bacterium]
RLSSRGHVVGTNAEHAIEVQIPFLQRTLAQFTIVPIIMGDQSYEACRELGIALAKLLKNDPDTLIVASSDLSHYHTYDQASRMDRKLLNAIEADDFLTVSNNTGRGVWEACGAAPIVTTMIAAERLGASHPKLLKYANSGDVTGDKSRVVGYSAIAFFRGETTPRAPGIALTDSERTELLRIAKASVESAVRGGRAYEPPEPTSQALLQERGVFVTLKENGELRGCIGYTVPILPLYQAVAEVAASSALHDPRFSPVKAAELSRLQYEISVLSSFAHVLDTQNVRIGEHGLLLRQRRAQGIFLPQVPTEQGWDHNTYLEQLSYKAELPRDAWRDDSSDLFSFTALVFSDHEQNALKTH